MSKRIDLDGMKNTRDLGGTKTQTGRTIAFGKLIRSGHLHYATPEDIERLSASVGHIVDFRSELEIEERPDPAIPGVEHIHLPASENLALGQTQDGASGKNAFEMLAGNPGQARLFMIDTYLDLVASEHSVLQYRRFARLLANMPAKAVLWHCTAGKDRAGFAAVIVQELLGVDRATIFEDYLQTNDYLAPEIAELRAFIESKLGRADAQTARSLDYLFDAREEYLAAAYGKAEELYGSFDGFIATALQIDDAARKAMQDFYTR